MTGADIFGIVLAFVAANALIIPIVFSIVESLEKFVCPYCLTVCRKKRVKTSCPACSRSITKSMLETWNFIFSIIGEPGSGKTNYITILLNELKKADGLKLFLSHEDSETFNHQNMNYKAIYVDKIPPPATPTGNPLPQIWSIKNLAKTNKDNVPTFAFTIFDGAGEDHMNNLDPRTPIARYISMSQAIIFALDPRSVFISGNMRDIINDTAKYIKETNPEKYTTHKRINIPVAVVILKFDMVWEHESFGSDPLVRSPSLPIYADGSINVTEFEEIHGEVVDWLKAVGANGLLMSLSANFTNYKFFGASSYGQEPKEDGTLHKPDPHRVLDPILWMFKSKGLVD